MTYNGNQGRTVLEKPRSRCLLSLSTICLSFIALFPAATLAQLEPRLISLSPFQTSLENVQIELPRKAYISFDAEKQLVRLRLTADLSDIRQKFALLALATRTDVCDRPGADSEISKVNDSAVNLIENQVWFHIGGAASRWSCIENPVPNSKVTWALTNVAPGIVTKVPQVYNSPGAPIKTTLDRDIPFDILFGISISWTSFGVDTKYTNISNDVINSFTEIPKLANQMAYAINPILAQSSILAKTLNYKFNIDRAAFFSDGANLSSLIDLSTHAEFSDFQKIEELLKTSN